MLQPSFFDRLLERSPVAGLAWDLERLLNDRTPPSKDWPALERLNFDRVDDRRRLARALAAVIQAFDPRLSRVRVKSAPYGRGRVRFKIIVYIAARPRTVKAQFEALADGDYWRCRLPEDRA